LRRKSGLPSLQMLTGRGSSARARHSERARWLMRIFLEPPYLGGSADQCARQAFQVLREAGVASARTGEILAIRPSRSSICQTWRRRSRCSERRECESWIRHLIQRFRLWTFSRFLVASARSAGIKLLRHAPTGMALALALAALIITGGGSISIRKLPHAPALGLVRWYLVLPPLHFVGPANDPYRLAIVSGAALLSRWLPAAPDDPVSRKKNGASPDSARKRP
jgi:hypothetical protein